MPAQKIALVTGANKGVGYGIVRQLLLQSSVPLTIYLTSRDRSRGDSALRGLHAAADLQDALRTSQVLWHGLDITDHASVLAMRDTIENEHGHLDVLINNAGIATKGDTFNQRVVETTMECNYKGTLDMCRTFLPLMTRDTGRIINVSSMAGKLARLSDPLQSRFRAADLTIDGIERLLREFHDGVVDDTAPQGWPRAGYAVSKMGVTAVTKVLAKENPRVLINAVCPGYVDTDMTSNKGVKTIDEGAMTPVHVAIGDIHGITGEFWENSKVSVW